jgi:oxygen-independent coproporphyrinogen III oxidase
MPRYHKALTTEIKEYTQSLDDKLEIDTIYFGGGTPSTYPIDLLLDTFAILNNEFKLSDTAEITLEVNPGTIDREKVLAWSEMGINRLSIGVQSLQDEVLRTVNRRHTVKDVEEAIALASDKFSNISVDLIVGLPGVSEEKWKESVERVAKWPIKHLSVYFLMVHEGTSLYFGVRRGRINLPCDDATVTMYEWTVERLKAYGFEQYEISSFAKPGYQSSHNKAYWTREPYQAFGLGACSFDGKVRYQNEKNLMEYMDLALQNKSTVAFNETLTDQQVALERIMLALRQISGMRMLDLLELIAPEKHERITDILMRLHSRKLIEYKDGWLFLRPAGLALHNEIVTQLSV